MDTINIDLEVPEILADIPKKLYPLITEINKYRYFLIDGGRGGAKSQTVARLLLWIAEMLGALRIVCGREIQNTIQESVYTLISDLIKSYNLFFDILASKITHKRTGSAFTFRGFREQGAVNIQGMEGVHIVWIDEAQAITKTTLNALIPTIRKEKAKIFFTMNRFERHDPVYDFCYGRPDCLHIKINYYENPKCPQSLLTEAQECKNKDEAEYRHIWLGEPLDQTEDFLISSAKLDDARIIKPFGDLFVDQSVMSVDLAGAGGDYCVASLLRRRSNVHWELETQRPWREKDTDVSVGKTVAFKALWEPTLSIVDKGGLGYPMFCTMQKSIPGLYGFDGSCDAKEKNSGNQRADGYLALKDFIDKGWFILGKHDKVIKQLEGIKRKYFRNGLVYIQSKKEMRDDGRGSPDEADSLMMAAYAIKYLLGKVEAGPSGSGEKVQRKNERRKR
jgi:phage terminase large subunit